MRVNCLVQEHNTTHLARSRTGPLDLESSALTTMSPTVISMNEPKIYDFFLNCQYLILFLEKLLIESTKSGDYEFLKKGSEKADGINDVEEFRVTEVSV